VDDAPAVTSPGPANPRPPQPADTVYAYLAASDATADTPTAHLGYINIGNAVDGQPPAALASNQQISFTSGADSAIYTGTHSGQANFGDYLALINNPANWSAVTRSTPSGPVHTAALKTSGGDAVAPASSSSSPS